LSWWGENRLGRAGRRRCVPRPTPGRPGGGWRRGPLGCCCRGCAAHATHPLHACSALLRMGQGLPTHPTHDPAMCRMCRNVVADPTHHRSRSELRVRRRVPGVPDVPAGSAARRSAPRSCWSGCGTSTPTRSPTPCGSRSPTCAASWAPAAGRDRDRLRVPAVRPDGTAGGGDAYAAARRRPGRSPCGCRFA
jgi:hypothetical protein